MPVPCGLHKAPLSVQAGSSHSQMHNSTAFPELTLAVLPLQYAGALLGLSNTFGAFPGVLGVTAVGFLLDKTGVWSAALFLPCAFCQLVGLVVYTSLASSERRKDWV